MTKASSANWGCWREQQGSVHGSAKACLSRVFRGSEYGEADRERHCRGRGCRATSVNLAKTARRALVPHPRAIQLSSQSSAVCCWSPMHFGWATRLLAVVRGGGHSRIGSSGFRVGSRPGSRAEDRCARRAVRTCRRAFTRARRAFAQAGLRKSRSGPVVRRIRGVSARVGSSRGKAVFKAARGNGLDVNSLRTHTSRIPAPMRRADAPRPLTTLTLAESPAPPRRRQWPTSRAQRGRCAPGGPTT